VNISRHHNLRSATDLYRTEMSNCVVVIPCYNEASRLDTEAFARFIETSKNVDFLFVDDGSRDSTLAVLSTLGDSHPQRVQVLPLPHNMGKAEAVRHGLLRASERTPAYVGFWDADLATPLGDIVTFSELLDRRPDIEMVFGSRVHLLGRSVRRRLSRHYLGRVFATVAAFALGVGIYDTQCGAKLFRVSDRFIALLQKPFIGGWIFDVEIIAREIQSRRRNSLPSVSEVIYEHPLLEWRDVGGSKIKTLDWFKVVANLGRIYFVYLAR
jgi:dolichyl-phosphate beta-glucosyltransferase